MFPGVPAPYATLFMGVIGVWALAFVGGLILGRWNHERTQRLPVWTKLVMIAAVLLIGGIEWLVFTPGTAAEPYARWIFLGLLVGALGDLVMAKVFPIEKPLIPGMALFAIGHVFYLLAIFVLRRSLYPGGFLSVALIVIPSLFAAALMWEFLVHNPKGSPRLNTAAFFYAMLIAVTAVFAAYFPVRSQIMFLLGIGMVLFLISDVLLSQPAIKHKGFTAIQDVIWIVYSTGQLLIALSIGEALRLLG
jgi:uncharacterized membrane protein YhhN